MTNHKKPVYLPGYDPARGPDYTVEYHPDTAQPADDETPIFDGLFAIELRTLAAIEAGTQEWGGMLGAMLPRLVNLGYIKPGIIQLTKKGRAAVDRFTALQNPNPQQVKP